MPLRKAAHRTRRTQRRKKSETETKPKIVITHRPPHQQVHGKPKIGVKKDHPPADVIGFAAKSLEQKLTDYHRALTQFQTTPTRPAVHDLRVAIRKLIAILDLTQKFIPASIVNVARTKLKEQVSDLGDLRDVQVQIATIRKMLNKFPELKGFRESLLDDEKRYLKHSRRLTTTSFTKPIESAIGRIQISLNARRASITSSAARKILEAYVDNSFDLVAKRINELNAGDYATIHRVRLAFKPFRYLIETFHPLLPTVDIKQVRIALSLARVMGSIQDCDVLMKNLVEYKWRDEERKAIIEMWQEAERRKIKTAQRLLRSLDKFSELWKPIPQKQTSQPAKMRTMYLLRHAIALQRGNPGFPLDSDRPLTPKGIRRMKRIANGMRRLGVEFDLILTSPYRRALETALILARQYRVGEVIQTTPKLTPETPPEELLKELHVKYGASKSIILVGHDPQLSRFISTLTAGNTHNPPILKKGGLCRLQIGALEEKATLSWLLTPKQLVAMA